MLKLLLVAELKPLLDAVNCLLPLKLTLRLLNVASPLVSVVWLVVPVNVPVPTRTKLTDTPLLDTLFPNASFNCTVTAGLSVAPAVALLGGWTNANCEAEAALVVNELLATDAEPLVAVSVLEPLRLMLKFANVATPFPSVV